MQCFQLISMRLQIQWCSGTRQPSAVAMDFSIYNSSIQCIQTIDTSNTLNLNTESICTYWYN